MSIFDIIIEEKIRKDDKFMLFVSKGMGNATSRIILHVTNTVINLSQKVHIFPIITMDLYNYLMLPRFRKKCWLTVNLYT